MKRVHKGKSLIATLSEFTVVDIETTGLSPVSNNIIEIGAVKYRNSRPVEVFQQLIRPPARLESTYRYIHPTITKITGITDNMVADQPTINEVIPRFIDFISEQVIVGHNVNFDINFLYDNSMKVVGRPISNDFVDTLKLSRKYLPELAHHSLSDITKHLNVVNKTAHRAVSDCYATGECYIKLCNLIANQFTKEGDVQNGLDQGSKS